MERIEAHGSDSEWSLPWIIGGVIGVATLGWVASRVYRGASVRELPETTGSKWRVVVPEPDSDLGAIDDKVEYLYIKNVRRTNNEKGASLGRMGANAQNLAVADVRVTANSKDQLPATDVMVAHWLTELNSRSNLESLALKDIPLRGNSTPALAEWISNEVCQLKRLALHDLFQDKQALKGFIEALTENTSLDTLELDNALVIEDPGGALSDIAKIYTMKSYDSFKMTGQLTDEAVETISAHLKLSECRTTKLDISENAELGDAALSGLLDAVAQNTSLIQLDVHDTILSENHLDRLFEVLEHHPRITRVAVHIDPLLQTDERFDRAWKLSERVTFVGIDFEEWQRHLSAGAFAMAGLQGCIWTLPPYQKYGTTHD